MRCDAFRQDVLRYDAFRQVELRHDEFRQNETSLDEISRDEDSRISPWETGGLFYWAGPRPGCLDMHDLYLHCADVDEAT